jgi:hypothetical protein
MLSQGGAWLDDYVDQSNIAASLHPCCRRQLEADELHQATTLESQRSNTIRVLKATQSCHLAAVCTELDNRLSQSSRDRQPAQAVTSDWHLFLRDYIDIEDIKLFSLTSEEIDSRTEDSITFGNHEHDVGLNTNFGPGDLLPSLIPSYHG